MCTLITLYYIKCTA